jgi:hypothetical protein
MHRRAFVAGIGGGFLAAPLAGEAQQAGKAFRIGILGQEAADPEETRQWQAFRQVLRERGWDEGVNLRIEYGGSRATPLDSRSSRLTWFSSGWT